VRIPAKSTIHAVLHRHGLVRAIGRSRHRASGTSLSAGAALNELWCADFKGEFKLGNGHYCYPLTVTDHASRFRRITRWEHEGVLEAMQARLDRTPEAARLRRQTVEDIFGTPKAWKGSTHFLRKTLPRVRAEMRLHVLDYNLNRFTSLLGVEGAIAVMKG
jgi:transposase InsO family protein